MIDLSRFNLTTPELKEGTTDTAKTYLPGQFPENQFFHHEGENIVFHAPTKAEGTTANSNRARCEVRETDEQGRAVNFGMDQYDYNFLQAAVTVLQKPKEGRTTIGQIHVKDNTRPLLKLFDDGDGGVTASVRTVFNQANPVNYKLVDNAETGTRFTYSIQLNKSGNLSIVIAVGGVKTSWNIQIDDSWRARLLYFKAGTYIQEDATSTTEPSEGSTIMFDKLSIRHENKVS